MFRGIEPKTKEKAYWFLRRNLSHLFRMLDENDLHHVIAWIMALFTWGFTWAKKREITPTKVKKLRILAFNRETFDKDLKELDKRTDLDIVYFPMFVYGAFWTAFMPCYMKSQLKYHYFNLPKEMELKKKLQFACGRVFPLLVKRLGFEGMVSANIDYSYDQCWIEAGNAFEIPFFSICKEGIQCDSHFDFIVDLYSEPGFRFKGQKITVFCERKKFALEKAGVTSPENIIVTGAARTDALYESVSGRKKWDGNQRKWVVLFTFKHQFFKAYGLWDGMLSSFIDAAVGDDSSDFEYIIKTRNEDESVKIRTRLNGLKVGRICVDERITFDEIAKNAAVVIGYNTTAIVEMMVTPVPVIVPHFEEALKNNSANMLQPLEEGPAYYVAKSKDHMVELIPEVVSGASPVPYGRAVRAQRDKIIEKFLYRIDGKRSKELGGLIASTISGEL